MKLFDAAIALEAFKAYVKDNTHLQDRVIKIISSKLESASLNQDWDYIFEVLLANNELEDTVQEDYRVVGNISENFVSIVVEAPGGFGVYFTLKPSGLKT